MTALKEHAARYKRVTIFFGYGLFVFLLLAVTISTVVPFGSLFFNSLTRHLNVALVMISLIAGSILPPVISYVIGDKTTRSKASIDHHFNGVLFGVASYWLSLFLSFIGADTISGIRSSFPEPLATIIAGWPIIATLTIMIVIAIGFMKTTKRGVLVVDYQLYRVGLYAGFIVTFAYILWNQRYIANASWITSVLYVVVPALLIGVSYLSLSNRGFNAASRLARAMIAASFGFIASSIAGQIIPNITILPSVAIGLLVLALYLALIRYTKTRKQVFV